MYKKHSTCNYLQPGLAAMHISRMCDLYKVAEEYKKASQNQIADGMQWWYKVHGAIAYDIPKSLSSWCSCTSSFFFNHACIFHVVIYCSAANKNIAIIIHRYKIRYTLAQNKPRWHNPIIFVTNGIPYRPNIDGVGVLMT